MPEAPALDWPIFHGNEAKRQVAFVVNVAWGNAELLEILDLFAQHNLTKTFFVVGRWVDKFPELAQEIYRRGHEFGNHAYSDPHLPRLSGGGQAGNPAYDSRNPTSGRGCTRAVP